MFLFKQDDKYGYNTLECTSTFQQRGYDVLEYKLTRKVERMMWTRCMTS
jgi:hypothetical protein